jgi:hypothetical protein
MIYDLSLSLVGSPVVCRKKEVPASYPCTHSADASVCRLVSDTRRRPYAYAYAWPQRKEEEERGTCGDLDKNNPNLKRIQIINYRRKYFPRTNLFLQRHSAWRGRRACGAIGSGAALAATSARRVPHRLVRRHYGWHGRGACSASWSGAAH